MPCRAKKGDKEPGKKRDAANTYNSLVHLLELHKNAFDLLSRDKNGVFACNPNVLAMTVVNVAQGYVGRIVLKQAKIGAAGYGGRYIEIEIALARFLLPRKCPVQPFLRKCPSDNAN